MTILQGNKRFVESQFKLEKDFEELVRSQSKVLFGEDTIFIKTKRKLKGLVLGNTIPDGFLFDLTDTENPEFYLVEFELQKHDFKKHILPQITNFFGFFRSPVTQNDIVKDLDLIINADEALKSEFKKYLGDKEIFKFLKNVCEDSRNILLVIDGENAGLSDTINNSPEWGKFVKILKVKAFTNENETLVSVEPEFVDLQNKSGAEILEVEHLTLSQRAMYAAELSTGRNSEMSTVEAAKKLKVSRDSAQVAKKIKQASPALAKLIKSGKLTLNEAEIKIATSAQQERPA